MSSFKFLNPRVQGNILAGGQPTAEDFKAIAEAGYKTSICVRPLSEAGAGDSQKDAEAAGMNFVYIPLSSQQDFTREAAEKLAAALDGEGPFLVHCKSGARVGTLFGLKFGFCDGMSADEAVAKAKELGLSGGEALVRMLLR